MTLHRALYEAELTAYIDVLLLFISQCGRLSITLCTMNVKSNNRTCYDVFHHIYA